MDVSNIRKKFVERYGEGGGIRYFHAPGRVNLIGEHTDYNGGHVFPCALSLGTLGAVRKRDDGVFKFASLNIEPAVEINSQQIRYDKANGWANYLIGIIDQFISRGHTITGLEILIEGNIPNGSGLSSSASIEVLTADILNTLFGCGLDMVEMVKLSQKAENEFMGVNCGIMDQYAVGMGKKDHAIFLDCMNIKHEYVPFVLRGSKLVIGNTKKQRGLADSKYNERRAECERAVEALRKKLDIHYLGDIDASVFEANKNLIDDPVVQRRAQHAVYENDRVSEAVKKLTAGDIAAFGRLMNQSHESLRDLYEVTGFELDTMVEEAWKLDGVIGSRMTGAGFGGCTVSIVEDGAVDNFFRTVGKNYQAKTGLVPEFYIAEVGDGAGEITG